MTLLTLQICVTREQQYVDGISLVGGIRGPHAKDPWGIFEPQNFDKFRKFNQQIIKERLEKGGSIFNVSPTLGGKSFGEGMPLGKWTDDMLARLLSVYKAMSGEDISYRNHEVRAGGDEENGTFKATAEQVAALEANEFLVVHKKPTDDPDVFLVHYYYPDPLHRTPKTQFLVASLEVRVYLALDRSAVCVFERWSGLRDIGFFAVDNLSRKSSCQNTRRIKCCSRNTLCKSWRISRRRCC